MEVSNKKQPTTHPPNQSPNRNNPPQVQKTTRIVVWWTIARVLWSLVVLTTIMQGWLTHAAHRDRPLYSLVLVGLFLVTELLPYVAALDQDLLALIATDSGRNARVEVGGGASRHQLHHHAASGVGGGYGALDGMTPVSDSGGSMGGEGYGPPVVLGVGEGEGEGEGEGQALYTDAVDVEAEDEEEGKVAGGGAVAVGGRG